MATKLYRMTLRRTYARVIIKGETGNEVIYEFTNGNPVSGVPAKCILKGEYEQNLLEKSDYFKSGIVKLEKVTEDATEKEDADIDEAENAGDDMIVVEDVKTVNEAIAYVADNIGEKTTNARQARDIAKKNGIVFPNLKVGKK